MHGQGPLSLPSGTTRGPRTTGIDIDQKHNLCQAVYIIILALASDIGCLLEISSSGHSRNCSFHAGFNILTDF